MITDDGERWHYLAVRSLSALLRGISSSNNGDFYCLNCFHSYRTHNKVKKHERVCNNHDYGHVDMLEEAKKILKYRSGEKSLKVLFIIYADLECLLKKEQSCQNNLKNSYIQRQAKHMLSICHICKGCFCTNENNEKEFKLRLKVRDHCHYTGKFTGAAHSICNLRYKVAKKFP